MSAWFNRGKYLVASGQLDWTTADVRVLLLDANNAAPYVFSADHNVVSELSAKELAGVTNYVRKALTGKTVAEDDAADRAVLDADDPVWSLLGACNIQAVVVYRYDAADTAADLLMYLDGAGYPASHAGAGDWAAKFTNGMGAVA